MANKRYGRGKRTGKDSNGTTPLALNLNAASHEAHGNHADGTGTAVETHSGASSKNGGWLPYLKHHWWAVGIIALLSIGAMGAGLKYLNASAKQERAADDDPSNPEKSAPSLLSKINPFGEPTAPSPLPTPLLDKQNIYAGGRLIAVETAGTAPDTSQQISDLVVWRPSGGAWYIKDSTDGTTQSAVFGGAGDVPVPADFDGDGLADFCVFRPDAPSTGQASWYIEPNGSASYYGVQFGAASDKPVPADFDGDGKADIGVWRYTDKTFYALLSSTNTVISITMQQFTAGQATDVPVPADYDGDGMADAAVFRPGATCYWYVRRSADNTETVTAFGGTGDLPAKGDYDGDGRFDIAVRRDSTNQWIAQQSSNSQNVAQTIPTSTITLQASDQSVQGDYDGDGKTDAAVWRPSNGTWYIRKSSDSQMRVDQWGQAGDVPVPAPMKR